MNWKDLGVTPEQAEETFLFFCILFYNEKENGNFQQYYYKAAEPYRLKKKLAWPSGEGVHLIKLDAARIGEVPAKYGCNNWEDMCKVRKDILTRLPKVLETVRKLRSVTQHEVGRSLGLNKVTIHHWETGRNRPTLEHLVKLPKTYHSESLMAMVREAQEKADEIVDAKLPSHGSVTLLRSRALKKLKREPSPGGDKSR